MTTFRLGHKIYIYFFFTQKFHYIRTLLFDLCLVDIEGGVSVSI